MSPDTLEGDPALLAGFRQGDRTALARVYRLYVENVAMTARCGVVVVVDGQRVRLGGGLQEGEVEVVVQDAFLRAFAPRARLAYDGLRPFGAWIASITRNLLIDRARGVQRDKALVALDAVDHEIADEPGDAAAVVEENELNAVVAETAAAWPPRERELFRLRFVEGLPQQEAAARMGLSLITVRRLDVWLRVALLAALRTAGHFGEQSVGIPSPVRDRSKG